MDQWTNRVSLSLIVGVLCLTVHTGCAVYLAARQAEPKDLSVTYDGDDQVVSHQTFSHGPTR